MYGKAMALYLEGLITYIKVDRKEGSDMINNSYKFFKLVDMENFFHKYKVYFDKIK